MMLPSKLPAAHWRLPASSSFYSWQSASLQPGTSRFLPQIDAPPQILRISLQTMELDSGLIFECYWYWHLVEIRKYPWQKSYMSGCYKIRVILDLYHFYIIYFKYYQFEEKKILLKLYLLWKRQLLADGGNQGETFIRKALFSGKRLIHKNEAVFFSLWKKEIFSSTLSFYTSQKKSYSCLLNFFVIRRRKNIYWNDIYFIYLRSHIQMSYSLSTAFS